LTKRFDPRAVVFLSDGSGVAAGAASEGEAPVEVESVEEAEGVSGIMNANGV